MLKRIADWLCMRVYGETVAMAEAVRQEQVDCTAINALDDAIRQNHPKLEAIKRDFLERGYERGRSQMRKGILFDLYLVRSDTGDMAGGEGQAEYHRKMQIAGGALGAATGAGVPQYSWWCVIPGEPGKREDTESCLGPLDKITPGKALQLYLELLDVGTVKLLASGK